MKKINAMCAAASLAVLPAHAHLEVCNYADQHTHVAVGFYKNGKWMSSGWWVMNGGDCKTVVGGELTNRYYYIHAKGYDDNHEQNIVWTGNYAFCAPASGHDDFTAVNSDKSCSSMGYRSSGFDKIDVGDHLHYRYTLGSPHRSAGLNGYGTKKSSDGEILLGGIIGALAIGALLNDGGKSDRQACMKKCTQKHSSTYCLDICP